MIAESSRKVGLKVIDGAVTVGGSEDISYMINRVMEQGGHATMFRELTLSPAPAHNRKYDFKEEAIINGVKGFCVSVYDIMK